MQRERERERNAAVVIDITKSSIWAALRVFDVRAWWALSCAIDKTLFIEQSGADISADCPQLTSSGAARGPWRLMMSFLAGHWEESNLSTKGGHRYRCCAQAMDGARYHSAGIFGAPSALTGASMMASSKPLAFSIERIMARTPEPKSIPFPNLLHAPAGKTEPKQSPAPLHCMIPLMPLACEPPHKLHVNGLDHPDAFSYNASELLSIGLNYKNEQPDATPSAIGQYKLFRPRVVNQASFHAMGAAVCYLNCGESACAPHAGLVNLHPMASYLLNAPLHARQKSLFSSEKSKPDRCAPPGASFKELSHSHLHHYMKESAHILSEKLFKNSAAKLNGGSPQTKPKVFTCEVCGKVRRARSIFCLAQIASCTFF